MNNIAIHPSTQTQIDNIIENVPQGMLLVGPRGIGKKTLAIKLAEKLLDIEDFEVFSSGLVITPEDGKSIKIEAIRQLQKFLTLKVISNKLPNRAVIIDEAQTLTLEAQHALLKTLEEPPIGTILILTTTNEYSLLPTIKSRLQLISVTRPLKSTMEQKYSDVSPEKFSKAYAVSSGSPGLLHALITDEQHPLLEATEVARKLLSQPAYGRLLLIDELSKKRELVSNLLLILQQMSHVGLSAAKGNSAIKWQRVLSASYDASEALAKNAQLKLVLSNLMLNM